MTAADPGPGEPSALAPKEAKKVKGPAQPMRRAHGRLAMEGCIVDQHSQRQNGTLGQGCHLDER